MDKQNKTRVSTLAIEIVAIALLMVILILSLIKYVNKSIYAERSIYLRAQTETTAEVINGCISKYADYADVCGRIVSDTLGESDNIVEYMDNIGDNLFLREVRLILVDNACTWYGENGASGRITQVDQYSASAPAKSIYITTGVDSNVESIVFKVRLDHPIRVMTDNGQTTVEHCAVVYYLDKLHEQVDAAFPYKSNRFIIDENGLMLYRNLELGLLVNGSNIFSKYIGVDFLHGVDGTTLLNDIKAGKTSVGEFEIEDGERYFICTSPLDINNWSVTFVLASNSLESGRYIFMLLLYISGIGLLFMCAVMIGIVYAQKNKLTNSLLKSEQEANAYLEQVSRAKSDFLSHMSHDIRTPINGIMGMTKIAMKEDNNTRTSDCLRKIEGASKHLLSLVNDVLDMSSIEQGKVVLVEKTVNIVSAMKDCEEIILGQMDGRDLKLFTEIENIDNPVVSIDELHLKQIVINILSNAVKYTQDGGEIHFRLSETEHDDEYGTYIIQVEDNGIGMSEEFLEHIWDSFSQEQGGSRTKFKGTGLGMAITKRLVDLMGGTIAVESEYEIGSCFTVTMPMKLISSSSSSSSSSSLEKGSISGFNILVAEDNDLNMEIVSELLEDEGAIVTHAENGKIAYELFRSNPKGTFDAILMDVMMPEMDGIAATKAIRALGREDAKTIPIVAMTANAFEDDIKATADAGMVAHLSKPIDIEQVVKTLSHFCGKEEKHD